MKKSLAVLGALSLALVCRAEDLTHFEVASIRSSPPRAGLPAGAVPAPNLDGGPGTKDPGQLTYRDVALTALIDIAYGVRADQVFGPGWPYPQRFDIIAKVPAGATREQVNPMLQNLLAERFNLQLHHESKILPVYALTVAKSGPKLKESAKNVPPDPSGKVNMRLDENGFPVFSPDFTGIRGMPSKGHMRWAGQRVPISTVAGLFSLDHPVVDQTGLTGEYDFRLDYAMASRGAAPVADNPDPAPDVFAAVENQLGLKLVQKNLPFDVLVIDHIDKEPTQN